MLQWCEGAVGHASLGATPCAAIPQCIQGLSPLSGQTRIPSLALIPTAVKSGMNH